MTKVALKTWNQIKQMVPPVWIGPQISWTICSTCKRLQSNRKTLSFGGVCYSLSIPDYGPKTAFKKLEKKNELIRAKLYFDAFYFVIISFYDKLK